MPLGTSDISVCCSVQESMVHQYPSWSRTCFAIAGSSESSPQLCVYYIGLCTNWSHCGSFLFQGGWSLHASKISI